MKTKVTSIVWLVPSLVLMLTPPLSAQHVLVGGPLRHGRARPPLRVNLKPSVATYYTPAQIRHAYGFDQLAADGTGQRIAIVDASGNASIQGDLDTFCAQFGLPSTGIQIVGPNSSGDTGWALETALDVEWAHAIAPRATIILSVARTANLTDLLDAIAAAVNAGATVVSMSWGAAEFSGENFYDTYFQAPGVVYVASSGDSGELTPLPEVEWPAVSPYVISVGGTSLYLDANNNRTSETAWSSSGGGLSSFYGAPSWQKGWSPYPTKRGVPDVSYVADPNTGVLVYDAVNRGWFVVGGTSAGAPQWAALIALANQSRSSAARGNADIYRVAGTAPPTIAATRYFDIASGNNGADPDDLSVSGYDLVTGLGSPVASGLVPALAALAPQISDFSISVSPNSQAVSAGGTTTYTVTATGVNGFSGTVALRASGFPSDTTAGFSPAEVTGSGSATLSIKAGSTLGTYTLTIDGTSGSLTRTANAALVVASSSFSISVSPTSSSVRRGGSTSSRVVVSPSGGFAGDVSLTATVSPSVPNGPAVSFNPQRVTGGSGTSQLIIGTGRRTARGAYTISVTGAGNSTQETAVESLNVN